MSDRLFFGFVCIVMALASMYALATGKHGILGPLVVGIMSLVGFYFNTKGE